MPASWGRRRQSQRSFHLAPGRRWRRFHCAEHLLWLPLRIVEWLAGFRCCLDLDADDASVANNGALDPVQYGSTLLVPLQAVDMDDLPPALGQ